MRAAAVYLTLEIRRALRRLPQVYAGAAVLIVFLGAAALLAGRLSEGEAVTGRVTVGVALPEGDAAARQVVSMLESLDSVKSLCDFSYGSRETCLKELEQGKLAAFMDVPEGFVGDILDGTNTPVPVYLPADSGLGGRIFAELARSGADTLGASQAGIYAMDELCRLLQRESEIPRAEAELNRIFLSFSLPRLDGFRTVKLRASGDVDTKTYYAVSMFVLFLMLGLLPAASCYENRSASMRRKLSLIGVGPAVRSAGRILATAALVAALAVPAALVCVWQGWFPDTAPAPFVLLLLILVCLAAAAFVSAVYAAAASLTGGILLLFLLAVVLHLLSGGFLPLVFLPAQVRAVSAFLPPAILMDGLKAALLGGQLLSAAFRLAVLFAAGCAADYCAEVLRS